MNCDTCPDPATWAPDETACNRAHCGECIGTCAGCQDDMADDLAGEGL